MDLTVSGGLMISNARRPSELAGPSTLLGAGADVVGGIDAQGSRSFSPGPRGNHIYTAYGGPSLNACRSPFSGVRGRLQSGRPDGVSVAST